MTAYAAGRARSVGRMLREHWLITAFLLLGLALRVIVSIAYWPGLELNWDSYDYLNSSQYLLPGLWHPSGYPLLLALLSLTGRFGSVVAAQHLMGLAMGVLVYLFALRLGARRWLAALAALPILIDGYSLDIEQFILPETLTNLLLLGGLILIFWRERVSTWQAGAAGFLLAAATLTRAAVLPVLVIAGLYLLLRGGRWRPLRAYRWQPLLTYCIVAAAAMIAYGAWYGGTYGGFGYSQVTGFYLYGRVAPFATCNYPLSAQERRLCPIQPVGKRTPNPEHYSWWRVSPLRQPGLGTHKQRNALGQRFSMTVIEHQPLDYASAVLADTWHYFAPGRWMTANVIDMQRWRFPPHHIHPNEHAYHVSFANWGFTSHINASPFPSLMGALRTYQWYVYMPGLAFLGCLIAALGAGLGLVRAGARRRRARWVILTLAISAVVVLVSPSLANGFSYRYGLPLLVLLTPAAAVSIDIGLDALARSRAGRKQPAGPGDRERPDSSTTGPGRQGENGELAPAPGAVSS